MRQLGYFLCISTISAIKVRNVSANSIGGEGGFFDLIFCSIYS